MRNGLRHDGCPGSGRPPPNLPNPLHTPVHHSHQQGMCLTVPASALPYLLVSQSPVSSLHALPPISLTALVRAFLGHFKGWCQTRDVPAGSRKLLCQCFRACRSCHSCHHVSLSQLPCDSGFSLSSFYTKLTNKSEGGTSLALVLSAASSDLSA